jgi:hypothetical protein
MCRHDPSHVWLALVPHISSRGSQAEKTLAKLEVFSIRLSLMDPTEMPGHEDVDHLIVLDRVQPRIIIAIDP